MTKYCYAGGQRIAMRKAGVLYCLLTGHLGSTSKVANANGALYSKQLYQPWGEVRYANGTLPTGYSFTGQPHV